ncbi:MAG: Stp1/IreP family PP2C-type Ser/Thr phosphatase [Anaerolineales bacterium]
MKCPSCHTQNRPDARFCQNCGNELSLSPNTDTPTPPVMVTHPLEPSRLPEAAKGKAPGAEKTQEFEVDPPTIRDTAPLPDLDEAFAPLPVGALIRQRYVVLETRSAHEKQNVYLAHDLLPARQCTNCGEITLDADEKFCAACGADLTGSRVMRIRYIIEENADLNAYTPEDQLLGMRLEHPGLLLPIAIFSEIPYGPERRYRVSLENMPPTAEELSIPQPLDEVLAWGAMLADALAHLHRHQVTLGEIGLHDIVIENEDAFWINLDRASVIPPRSRNGARAFFAEDVQGLAFLLLYLATGQQELQMDNHLPERIQHLFQRAINSPITLNTEEFSQELKSYLWELQQPEGLIFVVGRKSDVGQVRSLNEDSLLTLDLPASNREQGPPVGVFAVADGMGGHEAGDVASRITCQTISDLAQSEIIQAARRGAHLPKAREWLVETVAAANRAVFEERNVMSSDMGTTLVAAHLYGTLATIANVGDSRCYHLKSESMHQVTVDHSLVERLVATGQITREEASVHPQRNVIYRVVGDRHGVDVDLFERRLQIGEALLLCSDGLSGMISDDWIWQIWKTSASPQEACNRMVDAANRAGGEDNVTVVIVQVKSQQ